MSLLRNIGNFALSRAVNEKVAARGLFGAGVGLIATRLAMRSLPGALLVGGGLVAKHLWDRRREREALDEPMTDEDAEMSVARAAGEPEIAEGAMPGDGIASIA